MRQTTLAKIINTRFNLVGIETQNSTSIIDTFREYHSISGTPVYVWKKDVGLYRLDISHIKIPNTSSLEEVLKHIKNNPLQSIYLLIDFAQYMGNVFIEKSLLHLIEQQNKNLFIIDKQLDFSTRFKGMVLETKKMFKMKLKRAA